MNENTCVCCGTPIPEGRQACWSCEHKFATNYDFDAGAKIPSDKQIKLAADIANTLGIEFPMSSKDFTAAIYWKFIKDHIEEAKSYWDEIDDPVWDEEMMWFSPLNQ